MRFPPFKALFCNHPFVAHLVKGKNVYFEGFQADIFNDFVPKKIFNITFTASKTCFLGLPTPNGSFTGMLGEMQKMNLDLAVSFTRHNMIQDSFILSPTLNVEYAMYYYFLKMDIKLNNILSSIQLILQHSVKDKTVIRYQNKLIKRMSSNSSLSNFYIEIDRSNFLDTIEDLADHPNIYPILSKDGHLQEHFNSSPVSVDRKIWSKMSKRGLNKSLVTIKMGDLRGMIDCLNMLKKENLAYIINRMSISLVITGYCSNIYKNQLESNDEFVIWLSKLFSSMLISVPYNKEIDNNLRRSLDKYFETFLPFGLLLNLDEKMALKLRESIETTNGNCISKERRTVADASKIHSSLRFGNFLYAIILLLILELSSLTIFILVRIFKFLNKLTIIPIKIKLVKLRSSKYLDFKKLKKLGKWKKSKKSIKIKKLKNCKKCKLLNSIKFRKTLKILVK